jgi:hypothetical protein
MSLMKLPSSPSAGIAPAIGMHSTQQATMKRC